MAQQQHPLQGNHSQIICSGCRTLLVYPQGANNIRCALCSNVTPVPPAGTEMAQLVCGGCQTLLMYLRGATSVQCSVCHNVNLAVHANQVAHVNCNGCGMTLMYAYGAQSVKCAICNDITHVAPQRSQQRVAMMGPGAAGPSTVPQQLPQQQTVVVHNPPSIDEKGNLVSNMAVGITTVTPKK
eukprot:jgi/Mesvir1/11780/Mv00147-RA.1